MDKISNKLLKDSVTIISPSLTKLFNLSIRSHKFPVLWKCTKASAIFKSDDRTNPSNYRPISVLPALSKILEKIVHMQLYEYVDTNRLLINKQYDFRKSHSTPTALARFTDEVLVNMDKGQLCGAVFIDLSKPFDTVDHRILLSKLSHFGELPCDLQWFESYLSYRTHGVLCGEDLSSPLTINYGVPQGSILGPLLFTIYINDQPPILDHTNVSLYADDTILYCFPPSSTDMESKLNSDLFKIAIWLQENKLTLNLSKTKFMVMGSDRKLHNFPQLHHTVMEKETNSENHMKYFGVTISLVRSY